MQAVILSAGRGTRMGVLTDSMPKPMLTVHGKTLLEHKFDILPPEVDEIILIVGYMGGLIQKHFGGFYKGKKIFYVEQDVLNGTGGALWNARDILHDRFVVMMGDDLYSRDDIDRCIATSDWALLVHKTEHMRSGGCIVTNREGEIEKIEEGDHKGTAGLVGTNMFVLDMRIFDYPLVAKSPGSVEFGLPQTVLSASLESHIPFEAVPSTFWFQITEPEDLARAEEILQKQNG